jgi:hypothetical protein
MQIRGHFSFRGRLARLERLFELAVVLFRSPRVQWQMALKGVFGTKFTEIKPALEPGWLALASTM